VQQNDFIHPETENAHIYRNAVSRGGVWLQEGP
jgi:hypothetical protein